MHYEEDCYQLIQAGLKHKQAVNHCSKTFFALFICQHSQAGSQELQPPDQDYLSI